MLLRTVLLTLASVLARGQSLPLDLAGRPSNPFDAPGAKAIVLIFVRADCPISNRYAPEIQRLQTTFSPSDVKLWLVYPDPTESAESIRKHIRDYGYRAGALRDPEHVLVTKAEARITPEAAVFTPDGKLVYHGRIDDRYIDFGKARAAPTTHDLEKALDAVVAGKLVANKVAPAVGCFISDLK